ncbi:MAG: hypothetical protein LBR85_01490 [Oscillospiraceae bacterium]|jgi:hypothetical protein|nr:hypothetical protein [Oscillospiraceae bacterium]
MGITALIAASTAVPLGMTQTSASMKVADLSLDADVSSIDILLKGMKQASQAMMESVSHLGQYFDVSV